MFRKIVIICLIVLMIGALLTACSDGTVDVPQNDANVNIESQDADEQSETAYQAVGVEDTAYMEEAPLPIPSPNENEAISEDDVEDYTEEIVEEILTPEQSALIAFRDFIMETHTLETRMAKTSVMVDVPWNIGNIVDAEFMDFNGDRVPELALVLDLGGAVRLPQTGSPINVQGIMYGSFELLILGYSGQIEKLYTSTISHGIWDARFYDLAYGANNQSFLIAIVDCVINGTEERETKSFIDNSFVTIQTSFYESVFLPGGRWGGNVLIRQNPQLDLGITETTPLSGEDAPNGAGWALLTQIDRRLAESRPAAPQPPAPQQANVLQLLYDGLINHAFSELIINWDNGTRTVFYSFYNAFSGDIAWNMISRTGNVSEVFPTFARESNVVIIGFPRTTTRLYYLYGNGEGIFGDETLSWSFRNANGEISLFG